MAEPLRSLAAYGQFVAAVVNRATVNRSTMAVWSESSHTGTAEGEIWFSNGLRLRSREEIDFHAGLITSYGYEVYRAQDRSHEIVLRLWRNRGGVIQQTFATPMQFHFHHLGRSASFMTTDPKKGTQREVAKAQSREAFVPEGA